MLSSPSFWDTGNHWFSWPMNFRDLPYLHHPCTRVNYTCWTWVLGIQPQMFAWQALYQLSHLSQNSPYFVSCLICVCVFLWVYTCHSMCVEVRGQPSTLFKTRNHLLLQTPWWLAWKHSGILLFLPSVFSRSTRITHTCYPARLYIGSGAPNLGPHACVTSALPIEISLFCFCFWDKISSYTPS